MESTEARRTMAMTTNTTTYAAPERATTDYRAMTVATALFFMWGFLTSLNDILIPHLKSIFALSNAQAALIQFAFFGSYFLFAVPGGKLVEYRGYKQTMVIGLVVAAVGAVLFLPAAHLASYALFLGALVVLSAGIKVLLVSANPYVTRIGPASTASSRLNFSQAFNSLGTTIAPKIGGLFILSTAAPMAIGKLESLSTPELQAYRAEQAGTVQTPYIVITVILMLLATVLASIKLGRQAQNTVDYRPIAGFGGSIWGQKWLLLGAAGIFLYVGAEVSIGSFLIGYFGRPEIGNLTAAAAATFVGYYWGGAMIGRFIGSAVLQKVRTGTLLGICGLIACLLVAASMATTGRTAMGTILAVGLFNSIMFPSIFTLGLAGLGELTSKGSSLMVQAIVGGALIPLVYGKLADGIGYQHAFVVPALTAGGVRQWVAAALCYVYIAVYGFAAARRPILTDPLAGNYGENI